MNEIVFCVGVLATVVLGTALIFGWRYGWRTGLAVAGTFFAIFAGSAALIVFWAWVAGAFT